MAKSNFFKKWSIEVRRGTWGASELYVLEYYDPKEKNWLTQKATHLDMIREEEFFALWTVKGQVTLYREKDNGILEVQACQEYRAMYYGFAFKFDDQWYFLSNKEKCFSAKHAVTKLGDTNVFIDGKTLYSSGISFLGSSKAKADADSPSFATFDSIEFLPPACENKALEGLPMTKDGKYVSVTPKDESKTYYFDVMKVKKGKNTYYLTITESRENGRVYYSVKATKTSIDEVGKFYFYTQKVMEDWAKMVGKNSLKIRENFEELWKAFVCGDDWYFYDTLSLDPDKKNRSPRYEIVVSVSLSKLFNKEKGAYSLLFSNGSPGHSYYDANNNLVFRGIDLENGKEYSPPKAVDTLVYTSSDNEVCLTLTYDKGSDPYTDVLKACRVKGKSVPVYSLNK